MSKRSVLMFLILKTFSAMIELKIIKDEIELKGIIEEIEKAVNKILENSLVGKTTEIFV